MSASKVFKKTILGVSLIHGQFRALAVEKGQTSKTYEHPGLVRSADELCFALQKALLATQFSGRLVGFLLEDSNMLHQYHLVPPMAQSDLEQYLERMVNQDKPFPEAAVWRYRQAVRGRERTGLLLDVLPQSFMTDLVRICGELNLTPLHLFPLSAVFVDQVRILAAEPEDNLLLVTQAAGKLVFVVATGDGTPLFDRYLQASPDGVEDPERIGREIKRSLAFANQQLGKQVTQVWVMGEGEALHVDTLQPSVEIPVLQSPMTPDPAYWIWVGVGLPPAHASNFIPKEVRTGPARRAMAKVSIAAIAGLVCLSVTMSGLVEGLIAQDRHVQSKFLTASQALERKKDEWRLRYQEIEAKQQWIRDVEALHQPPVIGWFLSSLSTMLPSEIVLTSVLVNEEAGGWKVELTGQVPKDFRVSAAQLEIFEQRLTDGPFHLTVITSWRESWVKSLHQGTYGTDSTAHGTFTIVGRIV